jgi:hypothetical protein
MGCRQEAGANEDREGPGMTSAIAPAATAPSKLEGFEDIDKGAGAPAAPKLPPLQLRTPEQLKDGLVVEVRGAVDDALAAARLVQDAAQYVAQRSGTTMGLGRVTLNDKNVDNKGALGTATFVGTTGVFNLSERSTKGIMAGVERLRAAGTDPSTGFDSWTAREQQSLVEEASATLSTEALLRDFVREEFAVETPDAAWAIQRNTDAYAGYTTQLRRLVEQATPDAQSAGDLANRIANDIVPTAREEVLASTLATHLGGSGVPDTVVREIADTVPQFMVERRGSRTRLMEIQAWLTDHKAGRADEVDALMARLEEIDSAVAADEGAEGDSL